MSSKELGGSDWVYFGYASQVGTYPMVLVEIKPDVIVEVPDTIIDQAILFEKLNFYNSGIFKINFLSEKNEGTR